MDARVPQLTPGGQAVVNSTRSDGRKVHVEYASFDVFLGKTLRLVGENYKRLSSFGGVGVGLEILQLSANGDGPHNDQGVGACAKLGVDWSLSDSGRVALRLAGRYQLASAGVDIPNDAIVYVMALVRLI